MNEEEIHGQNGEPSVTKFKKYSAKVSKKMAGISKIYQTFDSLDIRSLSDAHYFSVPNDNSRLNEHIGWIISK